MSSELLLNWTLSTSAKASRNYNSKPLSLGKQNKLSKCRWWDLIRTNSQVKLVSKRTLHPRQHTSINDFYRVHCHQTKSQAMIVGLRWLNTNSQAGQRGSNPSRTAFFEVQALKANSPNSHLIAVWIYTQDYDRRVLQSKSRCNLKSFHPSQDWHGQHYHQDNDRVKVKMKFSETASQSQGGCSFAGKRWLHSYFIQSHDSRQGNIAVKTVRILPLSWLSSTSCN